MKFFENLLILNQQRDCGRDEIIDLLNYNDNVVGINDMIHDMIHDFENNQSCEFIYLNVDNYKVKAWQLNLYGSDNFPYTYLFSDGSIRYMEYSLLDSAKNGFVKCGELDCVLPLKRIDELIELSANECTAKWIMSVTDCAYKCFVDIRVRMSKQNRKRLFYQMLNY